jgi:hypothetical protein
MRIGQLSLALAFAALIAPQASATDLAHRAKLRVHHHHRVVRAAAVSPTTFIYGLCTFPTPEGLDRTCSTHAECDDDRAGERWQPGCWFR